MDKIIVKMFDDYVTIANKSESIRELESEIRNSKKQLKQSLSQRQKKLLLRIEDGKDSIEFF